MITQKISPFLHGLNNGYGIGIQIKKKENDNYYNNDNKKYTFNA